MSKSQYYVYVYFDPEDMLPFYVGKGKGQRYKFHITEAIQYGTKRPVRFQNIPKIKRIRGILDKGSEPIISKVYHGNHEQCLAEEIRLIAKIGRYPNGPLLNMTDGGDGTAGFRHSSATRELFSQQRKGRAVTRHSEEHKQRLRENNAGGKATRKKVLKLLPDATIVETFESMTAAAKSVGWTKNNFSHSLVKDGSLPLDGYFYRYEDSSDITPDGITDSQNLIERREKHIRGALSGKSVCKVVGEVKTVYESVKDAARQHPHLKYATIWAAIKYQRNLDGAEWFYA